LYVFLLPHLGQITISFSISFTLLFHSIYAEFPQEKGGGAGDFSISVRVQIPPSPFKQLLKKAGAKPDEC